MKKFLLTSFLLIFTQIGFSQNNYSLSFDGYGDYVDLGNNALFDFQYGDPFTISMWIHPIGLGGDKGLISKMADNGPVQYEVIAAGTSIRYGTGNQFLFGGQLEAGNWYHLIVTSDGSAKKIYINNQLIESGTFESMTSNGDNLYIGAHQPLAMPGWSWSGFIDEVSIWNVAFTQNDIDAYATNSLSGNENGLVCYYKFNEGSGSTLIDDGPNGINGNINGAIWSTGVPALPNPALQVLDLNIQVELESGGCAKHYYTPETDIGLQQNKIEEIYVSYESSNSVDCGGICGSTHLNLEILDQDGNILESLYSGDCFTPGTSGNVIFYPNTVSTSTIAPTLHLYTVDLQANSSATITGVGFSPVYGCTDTYAENYDPNASSDDGSCSGYPDNGDYSLSFDRNSVNVSEIGDYSSQVTVMGWVKTTDDQSYHAIVSGNCGNIMLTMHGGKILFGSQCSSPIPHDTYGTTELNNGEWYHVAATYDEYGGENNLKVYVNGNLEGESTKSGQFSGATGNFAIGSAPGGYEFINGNLDMVRIWNTALTQDQIQENMLSDNALVDDGLLADWKVSSGEGNILYDHSGNGNHGSIEGASYSAEIPSFGCTDPYANNFNPDANVDDGSCSGYPDNGQFSLSFDGIDDLVQINEPLFNPNEFSIAFYIKTSVNGKQLFWSGRTITASQHTENSFNFDLNEIDNFYTGFFHNDDGQSLWSYQNIYDNNYHQIVVTFKNGLAKHYIDGNLTASNDLNFNSINVTDGNFSTIGRGIGQPGVWGARFYEGNIDEIIIFDRSLTESDLTLLLSGVEYPDDISGHYKFNAGSGNILFDHSGNQKHGVISGATWSEDVYVPPIPPVIGGNNSLIFDGVDDHVMLNQ